MTSDAVKRLFFRAAVVLWAGVMGGPLMGGTLQAQEPQLSGTGDRASPPKDEDAQTGRGQPAGQTLDVPVSLDRIRDALAQLPPAEPLKGLHEQPTFRLEVQERQKFEQLMDKIKFETAGPVVAGGRDAYEQQQLLFPRIDNPRVQPYGAFSTGEIATLGIEALVEKYVAQKISHVFGDASRAQAEREAREEVARALAGYWSAQPASPPKN